MTQDATDREDIPQVPMSEQAVGEFLNAYDKHRVGDQIEWYRKTGLEYERSSRQIAWVSELAILGATVCGILTMIWSDASASLGITAAALGALSAAVTSWGDVIGFTTNADLYRDANAALERLHPERPERGATPEQIKWYVDQAENIMRSEVGSWTDEWRMVDQAARADEDASPDEPDDEHAD